MLQNLARNWWLLLLRGVLAIGFGLLAFSWPGLTLFTLVVLYGIFAIGDGIMALWAAAAGGHTVSRGWLLAVGLLGLAAGLFALIWPGVTAVALVVCMGIWAIARGVFEIVGAVQLRKVIDHEWLLIAAGVFSVLFGVAVLAAPGAGALALVWLIGAYAIALGVVLVVLSFKVRRLGASAVAA